MNGPCNAATCPWRRSPRSAILTSSACPPWPSDPATQIAEEHRCYTTPWGMTHRGCDLTTVDGIRRHFFSNYTKLQKG